jgi:FtsH-binding integral membrane protein
LIIDTQLILGGKNKELTLDNYVLGAILLYIDIIGIFLEILKIIGKQRNN